MRRNHRWNTKSSRVSVGKCGICISVAKLNADKSNGGGRTSRVGGEFFGSLQAIQQRYKMVAKYSLIANAMEMSGNCERGSERDQLHVSTSSSCWLSSSRYNSHPHNSVASSSTLSLTDW